MNGELLRFLGWFVILGFRASQPRRTFRRNIPAFVIRDISVDSWLSRFIVMYLFETFGCFAVRTFHRTCSSLLTLIPVNELMLK